MRRAVALLRHRTAPSEPVAVSGASASERLASDQLERDDARVPCTRRPSPARTMHRPSIGANTVLIGTPKGVRSFHGVTAMSRRIGGNAA